MTATADRLTAQNSLQNSFAGHIGHAIEPVIRPLGYDWQIGIGILSSFAAREAIVPTLAIVYGVGKETAEKNPRFALRFAAPRHAFRRLADFQHRDVRQPAGVLHSGGAMPFHHGSRAPRDERLEMAAVPDRLHDRPRLRRRVHRVPSRQQARG